MTILETRVQSTAISYVRYDTDDETMDVTFTGGQTYTHSNVPQKVFEDLRDSGSPGQYYHRNIKGRY